MTVVNNAECVHHWVLPSPNGEEFIQGYCKKCGVKSKPYRTYFEETWGFNNKSISRFTRNRNRREP